MRTFQWPNVISHGLMVGSMTVVISAPAAAVEPASTVGFVDRAALAQSMENGQPMEGAPTTENGWRTNPLRAGSNAGAVQVTGNSLRQVQPVSYEEPSDATAGNPRAPRGLQLRPHGEPKGIFSGWMGGDAKSTSQASRPATSQRATSRSATSQPATVGKLQSGSVATDDINSPASAAMKYLPKFQTNAAKRHAQAAAAKSKAANAGYGPRQPAAPTQLSMQGGPRQASYASAAAAAQSYQPRTTASNPATPSAASAAIPQLAGQPAKRRAWYPPENPNPNTEAALAYVRPPATKSTDVAAHTRPAVTPQIEFDPSSPTEALTAAHQFAATAKTEADYSKVFSMCQQIPASKASKEETAFGRELAAWSLNRRGQLRARAGKTDEARADFDLAIRVDAKCWRALHNRGVLAAQAGQFEPAFDDFHQTIELNPNFAKAYANRAALYVLAGELEPAQADYERALEIDPDFAVAHRGCGRTCHLLGRVEEAHAHLSRAIELAPRDAAALASRGDLRTDVGDYAAAADDYEAAIEVSDTCVDAYRGSAWLLATCPDAAIHNPQLAVERAETALRLQRKADTATLDTLAAAQAASGDFETATRTISRAIELAPPSERSVYQDRMQQYRKSQPYQIAPLADVQQAGYEQ
jgi:tetratricopeptide (TPR) repeat protein